MTAKRWMGVGLAGFAAISLALLAVQEFARTQGTAPGATASTQEGTVVYYFHGNNRCVTCGKFERYTESVLQTDFAPMLAAGGIKWLPVNVEEPANAHFIKDYALYGKAVVLSQIRNGSEVRWRNLDKIWDRIGEESGYRDYIRDEVRAFLDPSS